MREREVMRRDELMRRLRALHPLVFIDPVIRAAANRRLENRTTGLDLAGSARYDRGDIPRAD